MFQLASIWLYFKKLLDQDNSVRVDMAAKYIDKINFSCYEDFRTYPEAEYRCRSCRQVVCFNYAALDRHNNSDFSNLTDEDQRIFKKLEDETLKALNFLDFYCPKCDNPVRIYYRRWAGGRHGEGGYSIEAVSH